MMSVREELERRGERRGRRIGREEGRAEGREEGREEGRQSVRQNLISLLTTKFGTPAAAVLDRVEGGSQEQLARWTLAGLTASTPEEEPYGPEDRFVCGRAPQAALPAGRCSGGGEARLPLSWRSHSGRQFCQP